MILNVINYYNMATSVIKLRYPTSHHVFKRLAASYKNRRQSLPSWLELLKGVMSVLRDVYNI